MILNSVVVIECDDGDDGGDDVGRSWRDAEELGTFTSTTPFSFSSFLLLSPHSPFLFMCLPRMEVFVTFQDLAAARELSVRSIPAPRLGISNSQDISTVENVVQRLRYIKC